MFSFVLITKTATFTERVHRLCEASVHTIMASKVAEVPEILPSDEFQYCPLT